MRSLNSAIWTSGLPVSVGCVPYWSMRDFFCSLANTKLVHSCRQFRFFLCNFIEGNTLQRGCKVREREACNQPNGKLGFDIQENTGIHVLCCHGVLNAGLKIKSSTAFAECAERN